MFNYRPAIEFLKTQQQTDGSFMGYAATDAAVISKRRKQPTVFPTILLLDSLQIVPGTEALRTRATDYVLAECQPNGAWNYWDKASRAKLQEPYPDDLDDTACALAALTKQNPELVTGERLGKFAQLLTACENQPGGPYNTWLADRQATPQWAQIDIAVNANIGYALSLHQVKLRSLERYIDEQITDGAIDSAYYVGALPVVYFLARWYRGSGRSKLKMYVEAQLSRSSKSSVLDAALILSAGTHLNVTTDKLRPLVQKLLASYDTDHWPAAAFYVDPVYAGQQHYGGSEALTTGFALEALCTFERSQLTKTTAPSPAKTRPVLSGVRHELMGIQNKELRRQYLAAARLVAGNAAGQQVGNPTGLLVQKQWRVPKQTLRHLNLGSLNGWIAYTLQDNVFDGDRQLTQLTTASVALRRSYRHFLSALPNNHAFECLIDNAFDGMDAANAWELQTTRVVPADQGYIRITRLPDYGSGQQLAERSMGHSLAVRGLLHHVYDPEHPCHQALATFYVNYLIARQLNDDAHDWEEDLQRGHLSAVIVLLLQDMPLPLTLHFAESITMLREKFWTTTIVAIAEWITAQLALAAEALQPCEEYMDTAPLRGWLDDLQRSTATTLKSRAQTLEFMRAYTEEIPA